MITLCPPCGTRLFAMCCGGMAGWQNEGRQFTITPRPILYDVWAILSFMHKAVESVRVERFYLGCLAHASYLIISDGIAAVIDPQRDVDIYLDTAEREGARIDYVIETHLHADFISGHRELAERTGARIYIGDASGATFAHTPVKDGDSLCFGN